MDEVFKEIVSSKKYKHLYEPLILRICEAEYDKYPSTKERVKAVKNLLHSIYGAYLQGDIFKKAEKFLEEADGISKILALHTSTKERMANNAKLYNFIFDCTGRVESLLDIGCGFNPFSISYFPDKGSFIKKYYALDIDRRMADLINRYFLHIGLPPLADCFDIAGGPPDISADLAFLFKVLPVAERQGKNAAKLLLRGINTKYIAVTYPTKSLSGKSKGMYKSYTDNFREINCYRLIGEAEIGNEIVFVVDKNDGE